MHLWSCGSNYIVVVVFFNSYSLTQVIRKFAKQLDEWLKIALHDLPENLRNIKFECEYEHTAHNHKQNPQNFNV